MSASKRNCEHPKACCCAFWHQLTAIVMIILACANLNLCYVISNKDKLVEFVSDESTDVFLTCIADNNSLVQPEWVFTQGPTQKRLPQLQAEQDIHNITGAPLSRLVLKNVTVRDVGLYECLVGGNLEKAVQMYVYSNTTLLVPVNTTDTFINVKANGQAIIPCRPAYASKDVKVTLVSYATNEEIDLEAANIDHDDPNVGFVIREGRLPDHNGNILCRAESASLGITDTIIFHLIFIVFDPINTGHGDQEDLLYMPFVQVINGSDVHSGDTVVMTCTVDRVTDAILDDVSLNWQVPPNTTVANENVEIYMQTTGYFVINSTVTVVNVSSKGPFTCLASNGLRTRTDQLHLDLIQNHEGDTSIEWDLSAFNAQVVVTGEQAVVWYIGMNVHSHTEERPVPNIEWVRSNGQDLPEYAYQYVRRDFENQQKWHITLGLESVTADDMGDYTLVARAKDSVATLTMHLYVKTIPIVSLTGPRPNGFYALDKVHEFQCFVKSYPMNATSVNVSFLNCTETHNLECQLDNAESMVGVRDQEENVPTFAIRTVAKSLQSTSPKQSDIVVASSNGYAETVTLTPFGGQHSGFLVCEACSRFYGCTEAFAPFFITDLPSLNASYIHANCSNPNKILEGDAITITCAVSRIKFSSISWYRRATSERDWHLLGLGLREEDTIEATEWSTQYSHWSRLHLNNVSAEFHGGTFECRAKYLPIRTGNDWSSPTSQNRVKKLPYNLVVRSVIAPKFRGYTQTNNTHFLVAGHNFTIHCGSGLYGDPDPVLTWTKNGQSLDFDKLAMAKTKDSGTSHLFYYTYKLSHDNTTIVVTTNSGTENNIDDIQSVQGEYMCTAENRGGSVISVTLVTPKPKELDKVSVILSISAGALGAVIGVACLFWCIHKRTLAQEIRKYNDFVHDFKIGDPERLQALRDQELGGHDGDWDDDDDGDMEMRSLMNVQLDMESAQMLPYDEKRWELPLDKLKLGRELGHGEFGRVVKGHLSLSVKQRPTPVAVKMLPFQPQFENVKALISELKIMVHLGPHENLVNLYGACTKKLHEKQLYVVVEFCEHGSLYDVLKRHRMGFRRKTLELQRRSRRNSNRTTSTSDKQDNGVFRFDVANSSAHNYENMLPQHSPPPPTYLQMTAAAAGGGGGGQYCESPTTPEDSSKSEVVSLTMNKLFSWAKQIANGMTYLSKKRVLHGDLACRNVLLARNNVVKICDFGLARSGYQYIKENIEKCPMPVKWMAPESLREAVFTSKSDVWAFGVVLWELFSLGETPYSDYQAGPVFCEAVLKKGLRLRKPDLATMLIYNVMLTCWKDDPELRPSFSQLNETLSTFVQPKTVVENATYLPVNLQRNRQESENTEVGTDGYLLALKSPVRV